MIRFSLGEDALPEPVALSVPGRCKFGRWEVRAERGRPPVPLNGPERAILDAAALGSDIVVRAWREGDRIRPLGMDGTKTLQDLFTDRKVPRSLRHTLPVVTARDRVAWVAGVAISEEFRFEDHAGDVVILSAKLHDTTT
jgi:tRNA(Ile)-lysidine synthase